MRGEALLLLGLVALAGCREDPPVEPRSATSTAVAPSGARAEATPSSSSERLTPPRPEPAAPDPASLAKARDGSPVRADERVVLFPSLVVRAQARAAWIVDVHGWIFEPEESSSKREAVMEALREEVALPDDASARAAFEQRVRSFIVDNESGKQLTVSIGGRLAELPASADDGHFFGQLELTDADVAGHGAALPVRAILPPGDDRDFSTHAVVDPGRGILLISDIDDTVKITEVTDKKRLLLNTFTAPFRHVPGMAELYQQWLDAGGHLHFLSGSPWQLYEPLSVMLERAGFPKATFHLKRFNLGDRTMFDLLADPEAMKVTAIEATLARLPGRPVVLVGDSGEKDPEVYGRVARAHAERVRRIAIRDVTGEPRAAPRYQAAFQGVPDDRWFLFTDPKELPPL